MKIKNKNRKITKKVKGLIVLVVLLVAAVAAWILFYSSKNQSDDTQAQPSITVDKASDIPEKTSDSATTNKVTDSPTGKAIGISISALGQDEMGGPILVRTILSDADGGSCTYTFSKSGQTKTYTSDVIFTGTYYVCNYNVPFPDLSIGNWTAKIDIKQGNNYGTLSKDIQVK